MLHRVPALESLGVKQFVNGPESFTPDGNCIMGESPEVGTVIGSPEVGAFIGSPEVGAAIRSPEVGDTSWRQT